jgi:hypothetical protein
MSPRKWRPASIAWFDQGQRVDRELTEMLYVRISSTFFNENFRSPLNRRGNFVSGAKALATYALSADLRTRTDGWFRTAICRVRDCAGTRRRKLFIPMRVPVMFDLVSESSCLYGEKFPADIQVHWRIFGPYACGLDRYSLKPALFNPSLSSALSFSLNGIVSQRGKRSTCKPRSFISSQNTPRP